jgi:hypothetical protein
MVLEEIAAMCAQGGYEFADKTLTGIHDRVKLVSHATDKQKQAVINIKTSKKPRPGGAPSNFRPPRQAYPKRYFKRLGRGRRI